MVINGTDLRIWVDDVLVADATTHSLSIKMGSRKPTTKDTNRFGRSAVRRLEVTGSSESLLVYGNFETILQKMNLREPVKMDFGNISEDSDQIDKNYVYCTGNFIISSFDKTDPDDEGSGYTINFEHYSNFALKSKLESPTGLTAVAASASVIDLSWVNVLLSGEGVSIERSEDNINFIEIDTVELGVDEYEDTGLESGTLYYYRIRAMKEGEYSSYSLTASDETSWGADIPTGLTTAVYSDSRIDLSWVNVDTKGDGVSIERSVNGSTYVEIDTVELGIDEYSDTGLALGTKYSYRVKSYKGEEYSDPSNVDFERINPSVLSDTNTVGWFASDDLSTITKDSGDLVSAWNDKLGSGHNLLQATGSKKAKWGIGGIYFDGLTDGMKTAAFTWNQPEYVYMVFRQITYTANEFILDGENNVSMLFRQASGGTAPELDMYAGSALNKNSTLKMNQYGIARILFNGANSKLQINEETAVTGNVGASNAGGLTVGSNVTIAGSWSHIEVAEIICRKTADSGATESSIYTYLKNKYQGVWVKQGAVLSATLVGEADNVYEPHIIREGNPQILTGTVFKMWYSGGWGNGNIYYAESTDGITWSKYSGSPCVTGHVRGCILKVDTTYYLYCTKESNEYEVDLYTSSDGVAFSLLQAVVLTKGSSGQWDDSYIGTPTVWKEGSNWYMLYDGYGNDVGVGWLTGLATSSDGIVWTKYGSNPVINEVTTRGGTCVHKIGSTYWVWLIGAPLISGSGVNLPTDIYRYRSTDLHTWIPDPVRPVLSRSTADEGQNGIVGQCADPCLIEYNGQCYLYYSGSADGSQQTGNQKIKLAIADMTLEELINTEEGNIIA